MTDRPCRVLSLKRFGAFTLIELLVVISIMALLMAILLPALQKAKESGEMAKCQSNVKQIAIAHLTYTEDYKRWWFASNWGAAGDSAPADQPHANTYQHMCGVHGVPDISAFGGFSSAVPLSRDGAASNGAGAYADATYKKPTKVVNAYANLPTTNEGNSKEVFELFKCPGDDKATLTWPCIYSTYGSLHPSFTAWYGTKFDHWGSSYQYVGGNGGYKAARDPWLSVAGHPELDIPYSSQGLWGKKIDDVKLPSLQVITEDFNGAAWGQAAVNGWGTDAANWMFHGHTEGGWARSSGTRIHNMGHVDGHVKAHDVPDGRQANWGKDQYGTMYFNDEYRVFLED
jgi:prepilin-type N-terminal cleavage/methylation domain-containing protein